MKKSISKILSLLSVVVCLNCTMTTIIYSCNIDREFLSAKNSLSQNNSAISHPNTLEFSFVLLSSESDESISALATSVYDTINTLHFKTDVARHMLEPNTITTRRPHVSLGQYGIRSNEWNKLTKIVDNVADQFQAIEEPMSTKLSAAGNNIFFDVKNLYKNVNPDFIDLHLTLRWDYTNQIENRFMTAQAIYEQKQQRQQKNQFEVDLIDQYLQNWGIPECCRMRPHYTLVYNHNLNQLEAEKISNDIILPSYLKIVAFDQLGIVSIDFYGNCKELLYAKPLKQIDRFVDMNVSKADESSNDNNAANILNY